MRKPQKRVIMSGSSGSGRAYTIKRDKVSREYHRISLHSKVRLNTLIAKHVAKYPLTLWLWTWGWSVHMNMKGAK